MTMSRRNAVVGRLSMPGILTAIAEAAQDPKPGQAPAEKGILGPHVFPWAEMQFHKTATGEVCSLCKQPTATVDQLEMHVSKLNPGMASHAPHRHVNEEL